MNLKLPFVLQGRQAFLDLFFPDIALNDAFEDTKDETEILFLPFDPEPFL